MPKRSWQRIEPDQPRANAPRASLPIACLSGSVPVVIENCLASVLEPVQWTLLEHWTARCITEVGGFVNAQDIGDFLGLQELFVQPALQTLRDHQLIQEGPGGVMPTPGLAKAMAEGTHRKATEKRFCNLLEPESGLRQLLPDGMDLRCPVDKDAASPASNSVDELRRWATSDSGPLSGLEVANLELQSARVHRLPVEVRVFIDDDGSQWGWDVYDQGSDRRRQELRRACEAEGIHDLCRELIQEAVAQDPEEPAPPPAEEMYVPLHRLKSTAADILYLEARAAQNRVLDLIKEAKEEIIMFFPWIKSVGLRHIESHLRAALDRGVVVLIGYGIADRPEDEQSHRDVVERLAAMRSKAGHAAVTVRWLGSSHTKEMVIDRKHYLHGSHNMLSFVGEAKGQSNAIRRELMSFDSNRRRFWPALHNLRGYFLKKHTVPQERRSQCSLPDWVALWQALLHLGAGPHVIRAALAECPATEQALLAAARFCLLGLELMEADAAQASIAIMQDALQQLPRSGPFPNLARQLRRDADSLTCLHKVHRQRWLQAVAVALSS